jgi:hypothetical protein
LVKDFYYLARYQMQVPGTTGAAGAIIMPSGVPSHTLTRRNLNTVALRRKLLDPQMYLSDIQPDRCRKTCTCLASYPWFLAEDVEPYQSSEQTQAGWRAAAQQTITANWRGTPRNADDIRRSVDLCVEFQKHLGVETIILPSPLTRDHATDYAKEAEWLEIGAERSQHLAPGIPALATIAISDTCLRGFQPDENALIELILDQVSARARDGAYIVLEQANETTYNCTSANTVGSLLRLVFGLKQGGLGRIVVCYAGTAGLLTLLVGADAWATGWYRGERRLRLADIEQSEGRAMPAYYSHRAATEFHLTNDLARARDAGLLERIADQTDHSRELLRALRDNLTPQAVAPWQPRQSNVTAARAHFATALIRETERISRMNDDERIRYGTAWLEEASDIAAALYQVGEFNPRTELDHQRAWREAFSQLGART